MVPYTSVVERSGAWTSTPTQWSMMYLANLFAYEWEQTRSPAGALQWTPVDKDAPRTPDAHLEGVDHPLMMMTSDIALKVDPSYRKICEKFLEDFDYFTEAFSKAWYKLTHRDMGPKARYVGPDVPAEDLIWQDPVPAGPTNYDIGAIKSKIAASRRCRSWAGSGLRFERHPGRRKRGLGSGWGGGLHVGAIPAGWRGERAWVTVSLK